MDYIPPRGLWHPRYGKYGQFVERLERELLPPSSKNGVSGEFVSTFESIRRDHLLSSSLDLDIALAAKALLRQEIVKKFAGPDTDVSRLRSNAIAKFYEGEAQCKKSNLRWSGHAPDVSPEDRTAIMLVRAEIQAVLGRFSWDAASTMFGWGPGSSTRIPYKNRHSAYKYSGKPHCTPMASCLATAAMQLIPRWIDISRKTTGNSHHLQLVAGNDVLTVPKDDRSDRIIAREPCMNLYLQRGIGGLIRKRLKSAGLDLNTQDNNRNRCVGGRSLEWATIDLSMASDTLAYEVVRTLSPEDWFTALDETRSTVGMLDDTTILYEKFSSMGNGYTFELESLIFWCVARVVVRQHGFDVSDCLTFGDDIIVPEVCAESVIGLLDLLGFVPNVNKSFFTGPFRESCGMQTWYGEDISPFYIKRPIETSADLYLLHNNLQRWLWRVGYYLDGDDVTRVKSILKDMRRACFSKQRFYIPDGYGDGGFIRPCNYLQINLKKLKGRLHWEVLSLPHSVETTEEQLDDLPDGALVNALEKVTFKVPLKLHGFEALDLKSEAVVFREFQSSAPEQPVGRRTGYLALDVQDYHDRRVTEQWLEELS